MGEVRGAAAALALLLAGCAGPPPPAYPAPSADEARLAYADALQAALVEPGDPNEPPPEGKEESYIEAMARGGRIARAEQAIENNARVHSSIETLSEAAPSGCEWKALDLEEATGGVEDNRSGYPAYAYHCTIRVVHNTPTRGLVAAAADGWFFRERGAFVYVGKAAHGFKEVAAGEPPA
jgi:hypothetical protein